MDTYLQKNWKTITLIFIVILGLFYWFEVRPSNIAKECYEVARYRFPAVDPITYEPHFKFEGIYQSCLQSEGL